MVPLAVVALFVLFAVLAFSIDQGIAYAAKARQENVLDEARATCMDAAHAFAAKSSENPGAELAELVVRQLRANGYEGGIAVWFYEAPAALLPENERLWVMGMQLEERVPTAFARGFGIADLPVASHRILSATPYAEQRVWRPQKRIAGRWALPPSNKSEGITFMPIESIDGFPVEMAAELQAALTEGSSA